MGGAPVAISEGNSARLNRYPVRWMADSGTRLRVRLRMITDRRCGAGGGGRRPGEHALTAAIALPDIRLVSAARGSHLMDALGSRLSLALRSQMVAGSLRQCQSMMFRWRWAI